MDTTHDPALTERASPSQYIARGFRNQLSENQARVQLNAVCPDG
jgi:hypothetical protein